MAPPTQKVATARAMLEHALKAETGERERIAAFEAEKTKLQKEQESHLIGWGAGEPEAVAAMESLDAQLLAIGHKIGLHRRVLVQLQQKTQQTRSAKLAIENEHAINGSMRVYDQMADVAQKITESIEALKAHVDAYIALSTKAANSWPGKSTPTGRGLLLHGPEALDSVAVELWRLLSSDEPHALRIPGWMEWDKAARKEFTGQRPAPGVTRQMLVRPLAKIITDTREMARQLLTGERGWSGTSTPLPEQPISVFPENTDITPSHGSGPDFTVKET